MIRPYEVRFLPSRGPGVRVDFIAARRVLAVDIEHAVASVEAMERKYAGVEVVNFDAGPISWWRYITRPTNSLHLSYMAAAE
jgi:hypothetical protein